MDGFAWLPMPGGYFGEYCGEAGARNWLRDWRRSWDVLAIKVEREGRYQDNAMRHAMSYHRQETQ